MINLIKGLREKPDSGSGWHEYEYNGNYIIEFIHPDEEEKEILHRFLNEAVRIIYNKA